MIDISRLMLRQNERDFIDRHDLADKIHVEQNKQGIYIGTLEGHRVDASLIVPNGWNFNEMEVGGRNDVALKESLDSYTQLVSLVVRVHPEREGYFEIADGEQRHRNLQRIIKVVVVFGLCDRDFKKLTIALSNRGETNPIHGVTRG